MSKRFTLLNDNDTSFAPEAGRLAVRYMQVNDVPFAIIVEKGNVNYSARIWIGEKRGNELHIKKDKWLGPFPDPRQLEEVVRVATELLANKRGYDTTTVTKVR